MKQLISTKEVREAVNQNKHTIFLEKCHIITPAARDMAKEHKIKFSEEDQICADAAEKISREDKCPKNGNDSKSAAETDVKCQEIDIDLICMIVIETLKQIRERCDR